MRIIGLDEFLLLPAGAVFAKYRPQMFGELCVKGDSTSSGRDFRYKPLWDVAAESSGQLCDLLTASESGDVDVPIDAECWQRDGCFDDSQLFAVFRVDEVALMARTLIAATQPSTTPPSS